MKSFLIILLLISSTIGLFAQSFDWARSSRSTTLTLSNGIATDAAGNSVVIGNYFGQSHFDTLSLFSNGRDIFVVRYNAEGKRLWGKRFGSTGDDFGNAVAYDPKGNIAITGSFTFKMPMDNDTLSFKGDHDVVVAKLDAAGKVLWAKSAGGPNADHGAAIACDSKGNTFVAGYFRDTITFDHYGLGAFSKGLYTMFLAKYDNAGKCEWAKALAGSNFQSQAEGIGLDVDAKGNVYISGSMHGPSQIDTIKRTPVGITDIFITKISATGSVQWLRTIGSPTGIIGVKALKWNGSSIVLCGNYITGASFDGGKTILRSTLGYQNAFVAKYDDNGNFAWVKDGSGRGQKSFEALTLDSKGNIYAGALFTDSLTVDSILVASSGRQSFAAISLTSDGSLRYIRPAGRTGVILTHGIGVDKHGDTYYTGAYNDTAAFGRQPLVSSNNGQDMFIAKLSSVQDWRVSKKYTAPAKTNVNAIALNTGKKQLTVDLDIAGVQYGTIDLYDALGNVVASYLDQQLRSGNYTVTIDLKKIPSDAYYLRIQLGISKLTKRIEF